MVELWIHRLHKILDILDGKYNALLMRFHLKWVRDVVQISDNPTTQSPKPLPHPQKSFMRSSENAPKEAKSSTTKTHHTPH